MKNKYLISVIIPIYNAEEYLHKSIGSVLSQTTNNYELLLINDGSTDNSLEIIKKYEKEYENIRVISRKNKGILKTRLEGVENAKGEYIVFLDADDILPSDTLKKYIEYLKKGNYDIIKGNYEKITKKKNLVQKIIKKEEEIGKYQSYIKFLTGPTFNNIWGCIIKKNVFNLKLNLDISMGDDQAIMLLNLEKAKRVLLISDTVYKYRINETSITNVSNVNKKCKNYDEVYMLYSKIVIPFFKKLDDNYLLKKACSRCLRDLNMLFCEICQTTKNKKIILEYQDKLFNDDLTKEVRKLLTKKDIKQQKTYIFIKPILENKKKKHLRNMRVLKLIKR